ncbi:MAG: hypothetical protein M3328_05420, partial [Chloroflexota bacterium]|nr:hypothetical protein [Chloroflexota bacterium]
MQTHHHTLRLSLVIPLLLAFLLGSVPAITPTQRAYAADTLQVSRALTLSKSVVHAGEVLSASVTYKNSGSTPVSIQDLVITARPPGGTHAGGPYYDFSPRIPATTIQPSAELSLVASRTFASTDPTGKWEAYSTYQDVNAAWHDDPSVFFSVEALSSSGNYFPTLKPGSALPSGADCASRVRRNRWEPSFLNNYTPNHRVPTTSELSTYRGAEPHQDQNYYWWRVTGNFTGTTDELIQ